MSLSNLPPELIVQVVSFLDFPSVVQLAMTNKRNYNIIKRYKLDRPEIFQLKLEFVKDKVTQQTVIEVTGQLVRTQPFTLQNLVNDDYEGILAILNKFSSIKWLDFTGTPINTSIYDVLINSTAKIDLFMVARSTIEIPVDKLVELFSKYNKVDLFGCCVPAELLTDKIFCQILHKTELSLISCVVPTHIFTCELTDLTLKAIGEDKMQEEFSLNNWINNFTVPGIMELVEKVLLLEKFDVWWDLGMLRLEQFWPANDFAEAINRNDNCPYHVQRYQRNGSEFLIQLKEEDVYRRRFHIVFQVEDALA